MRLITSEEVTQVSGGESYLEEITHAIANFLGFGDKSGTSAPKPATTCVPSNSPDNSASMMCGASGTSTFRVQAGSNVVIGTVLPAINGSLSVNVANRAGGVLQGAGAPTTSLLVCPTTGGKCYVPSTAN